MEHLSGNHERGGGAEEENDQARKKFKFQTLSIIKLQLNNGFGTYLLKKERN